jgi:hypothetical protein
MPEIRKTIAQEPRPVLTFADAKAAMTDARRWHDAGLHGVGPEYIVKIAVGESQPGDIFSFVSFEPGSVNLVSADGAALVMPERDFFSGDYNGRRAYVLEPERPGMDRCIARVWDVALARVQAAGLIMVGQWTAPHAEYALIYRPDSRNPVGYVRVYLPGEDKAQAETMIGSAEFTDWSTPSTYWTAAGLSAVNAAASSDAARAHILAALESLDSVRAYLLADVSNHTILYGRYGWCSGDRAKVEADAPRLAATTIGGRLQVIEVSHFALRMLSEGFNRAGRSVGPPVHRVLSPNKGVMLYKRLEAEVPELRGEVRGRMAAAAAAKRLGVRLGKSWKWANWQRPALESTGPDGCHASVSPLGCWSILRGGEVIARGEA